MEYTETLVDLVAFKVHDLVVTLDIPEVIFVEYILFFVYHHPEQPVDWSELRNCILVHSPQENIIAVQRITIVTPDLHVVGCSIRQNQLEYARYWDIDRPVHDVHLSQWFNELVYTDCIQYIHT